MLGLGNTVSSGSALESLYSLTFDGTDDYMDLGDNIDLGTDNFTISLWAKFADATHSGVVAYFLAKDQNAGNRIRLFLSTGGKIQVRIDGDDGSAVINTLGATAVTALEDTWVHVCVSCARDGNLLLYVNGSTSTYGFSEDISSSSSVDIDNTGPWIIGARDNSGTPVSFFNGKIDEVSIWNVALDADAVTAIYNSGKPIDLTFDSGNYDNSSALQGYWRMGNGSFDDKANGVIHDQHAPGFGNNLVVWDGSTTGDWNETQSGNTTLSANSGKLRATADAAGAYGTSRNFTTVVDAVYKVEGTIDVDNASGGAGNFRVSNNLNLSSQIATLSTSTGTFKSYFTATATTTHVGVIDTADDDTNYMEIEEISVRQLNGIPGLTSDADGSGFNFTSDTP